MNLNRQQSIAIGVFLITLGAVIWFNLWWLIVPGALAAGGIAGYVQRRRIGRREEALQIGLWGIGLALVFLLKFWVGLLFLAGLSVLMRGREQEIDDWIQRTFGGFRRQRAPAQSLPVQHVPVTTQQPAAPPAPAQESQPPATGETTRL